MLRAVTNAMQYSNVVRVCFHYINAVSAFLISCSRDALAQQLISLSTIERVVEIVDKQLTDP